MAKADVELIKEIVADVKAGKLHLPSPPEFAQSLHKAIEEERRDISYISRIIQYDPGLTTRIIGIANSPLFRGSKTIESCHAAVTRIGLSATRQYVFAFTMNNAFSAKNHLVKEKMDAIWEKSRRVAVLSFILADITPGMDKHRALMAGLIHNIGSMPVLIYADKYNEILSSPDRLNALLKHVDGKLGTFVLKRWKFDDELARIPVEIDNWYRDPSENPDYADIVNIACAYDAIGKPDFSDVPKLVDLPSFKKLPLSKQGPEGCVETLEEAEMEMGVVMALL